MTASPSVVQKNAQLAAVCYGVRRASAVVVQMNPMNQAQDFWHVTANPQTRVVTCTADPAAIVVEANAAPGRVCSQFAISWPRISPPGF